MKVKEIFPTRNVMQSCWVVPDLETSIQGWARQTGVGPFFWMEGVSCTEGQYRGETAEFPPITAAIAYSGDFQIELVQLDDDEPSMFTELVPRGSSGLHHMALVCKDYDADMAWYAKAGAAVAFEGRMRDGTRTSWVDTSATLGFMMELVESSPVREALFAKMHRAAVDWDGKEAIVDVSTIR